jgi:cyclase
MNNLFDILDHVSMRCFIPLTFGGNVRTIEMFRELVKKGADKVLINTIALENPSFITKVSDIFGSQCVVVGIDVKKNEKGDYEVYSHHGKNPTGKNPLDWAKEVEVLGGGEIFLNSIDRDGTAEGYDLELIKEISSSLKIPVIACGGVGIFEHFAECLKETDASAVAAGNIFNYTENSVIRAKKLLVEEGLDIRN